MADAVTAKAKRHMKITDVFTRTRRSVVAARLRSRFALRVHTAILLLWTFSAGLLTTKALFELGVQSMFWRYTLAMVVAYGAFLLGVRVWLLYVGAGGDRHAREVDRGDASLDISNLPMPGGDSWGGSVPDVFAGHGGSSGGGGASASFDGGDGGGSVLGDIGGSDEGCLVALAIMIIIGIIALAIGGAVFVISLGPEILIDAAFAAMLTGGLIKAGKKVSDPDWIGSVFKATWLPFGIVLALMWAFAATATAVTPQANTFGEVWRIVWPKLWGAM